MRAPLFSPPIFCPTGNMPVLTPPLPPPEVVVSLRGWETSLFFLDCLALWGVGPAHAQLDGDPAFVGIHAIMYLMYGDVDDEWVHMGDGWRPVALTDVRRVLRALLVIFCHHTQITVYDYSPAHPRRLAIREGTSLSSAHTATLTLLLLSSTRNGASSRGPVCCARVPTQTRSTSFVYMKYTCHVFAMMLRRITRLRAVRRAASAAPTHMHRRKALRTRFVFIHNHTTLASITTDCGRAEL